MASVVDICNQALDRISWPEAIGDIYEGSKAARVALRIYGQTRDDILRANDYPFSRRDVALTANGQAPPYPWSSEYAYPADCLRIRQVMPAAEAGIPGVLDPRPVLFTDFNDQRLSPPALAILANLGDGSPAMLVYTAKITDPTTFDANYIEALVENLARRFAAALEAPNMIPLEASLSVAATNAALASQSNRPPDLMTQVPPTGGGGRRGE